MTYFTEYRGHKGDILRSLSTGDYSLAITRFRELKLQGVAIRLARRNWKGEISTVME